MEVCFKGTASRIQGVSFDILAEETLRRHALGYPERIDNRLTQLPNLGEFHWRAEGEKHAWSPAAIADLQVAARNNNQDAYWRFVSLERSTRQQEPLQFAEVCWSSKKTCLVLQCHWMKCNRPRRSLSGSAPVR